MRYAIINPENNSVENVVEYESAPTEDELAVFGDGYVAIQHDTVSANWTYDGNSLIDPSPATSLSGASLVRLQITELESQQTPRRLREAILGIDNGWLKASNDQIIALRGQI